MLSDLNPNVFRVVQAENEGHTAGPSLSPHKAHLQMIILRHLQEDPRPRLPPPAILLYPSRSILTWRSSVYASLLQCCCCESALQHAPRRWPKK